MNSEIKPEFKKSKFVMKISIGEMELVWGKLPTKDGQLWKGECLGDGEKGKMEFAGNSDGDPTPYWGWSS